MDYYMTVKVEQLHTAVWIYDIDFHVIVSANPAALKLWDSPSLEELFSRDFTIGQSEAVKENIEQFRTEFKKNKVVQQNWSFMPKGKDLQALCQLSGIQLEDGRLAMLVEAVTGSSYSHMQLKSAALISLYTINGKLLSSNPPFIKSFGTKLSGLSDMFCDPEILKQLFQSILNKIQFEKDVLLNTEYGKRWFEIIVNVVNNTEEDDHILINHYDIHESKTTEDNLRLQAWEDPLTGLINRRGLANNLIKTFANEIPFTMLYIDLDGFKMINDSLGHLQGDDILLEVTQRLKNKCFQNNLLCRYGGDEFIFIIENKLSQDNLEQKCQQIIESLSQPYKNSHGIDVFLSASIGVADYPTDAKNFDKLAICADTAMYRAKMLGKKQWVRYQLGMENLQKRRSLIVQKLSFAIKNEELNLYYQPILDVSENKIVSFEALLRWNNTEIGPIGPEDIIKIAEETGLIYDIENWVLKQSIHDLVRLKKRFHPDITMAVNVSALHLINKDIVLSTLDILNEYGLFPHDLVIELTESVFLTGLNQEKNPLQPLIDNGIKVNIDDFGTGYSSLAYLHDIPATTVKVDKSFLTNIDVNITTLSCIHQLISGLSMNTLIEGIETEDQANRLKKLGYNLQQGYYHGRPQSIEFYFN